MYYTSTARCRTRDKFQVLQQCLWNMGHLIRFSGSARPCDEFPCMRTVLKSVSNLAAIGQQCFHHISLSQTRPASSKEISVKSTNFQLHILSDKMALPWKVFIIIPVEKRNYKASRFKMIVLQLQPDMYFLLIFLF